MTRPAVLALALALVALPLSLVPTASAHCPAGSGGTIFGTTGTCPLNQTLEDAVDAINDASEGQLAIVLVKDFRFHPPVATVRSGGTVLFLYADTDQNQQHDPISSGPCAAGGSPLPDPEACVPTQPKRCFAVDLDDGTFMTYNGQTYPLTFRYTASTGLIEKSRGLMSGSDVGDLTGARPFVHCAPGSGYNGPVQTVIAYHCGIHGTATSQTKEMRGAIIVEA